MPRPDPGVDLKGDSWTYGCEHELADWNCAAKMHPGLYRTPDHTVVNTNGVAAQPNTKVYGFGGEVNTPPTSTPGGQVALLECFLEDQPQATVNHRSNLHLHVRVPGLRGSLKHLKQLQRYVHQPEFRHLLAQVLEPIPSGTTPAERKRARRRKVSHQTFLTDERLRDQLSARTVTDFFEREVPRSRTGKVMWHAQPRCCVNLRQLLQTDTVEFRHFPGTLDPDKLRTCVEWCRHFLLSALAEVGLTEAWGSFFPRIAYIGNNRARGLAPFPTFPTFNEEREVRYQATASKNGLSPARVRANIDLVLKGKFNAADSPDEYEQARQRAGCVPR